MKVYLVIERENEHNDLNDVIFGIFTSEGEANKIKNDLMRNFAEWNEPNMVEVVELNLDEPTEDYHWFMNCC